ncbi:hypothetical protein [Streptomyces umbrinus]|uniref:hypothetical protein n=1 Tax=Streptomyces umbrinus TaxID=67370 RepID=UPI0033E7E004
MQLNLPVQGAVDRLREPYEPFLTVIAEITDDDGQPVLLKDKPGGDYGPLPGDPRALPPHARGWRCASVSGCVWTGII